MHFILLSYEALERHSYEDYVRQMKLILQEQPEIPTQRGADLPWWGKQYFMLKEDKLHISYVDCL